VYCYATADCEAMSDDPPPPYTAQDEVKLNLSLQPTAPVSSSSSVSCNTASQDIITQATAVAAPVQCFASALPPGYATIAYYPVPADAANASALLQPQQQQIVVIPAPVVVVPSSATTTPNKAFIAHICLSFCSCCCCWCGFPCSIVAFILASKSVRVYESTLKYNEGCRYSKA